MDKLYYWTGYVVWLCAAWLAGCALGRRVYDWRKRNFAIGTNGVYVFGYALIWRGYSPSSPGRNNVFRVAYQVGMRVRRWGRWVVINQK